MRRLLASLATLTALAAPAAARADAGPPVVAVFDVEARGVKLAADVLDRLSSYVTGRVGEGGRFQVVPRDQIKARLVQKKKESYKQCYAQSCQIELGQELAAQKTLATQVLKLGSQCKVGVTLFDLSRATTEDAANASGPCTEDGIVASLDQALAKLIGIAPATAAAGAGTAARPAASPADVAAMRTRLFELLVLDLRQEKVAGDPAAIEKGYQEVCAAGLADACRWREWHHADGPSLADAGRAFTAACDREDALACTVVAWSLTQKPEHPADPDDSAPDPSRGAALLDRACEKGSFAACRGLGRLYHEGVGVKKDRGRAAALYGRACDGGNATACTNLGGMHLKGAAVPKDEARAVELHRRACDGGSLVGCCNLASLYLSGTGVQKDEARSFALYRRACDGGCAMGCRGLGNLYVKGAGVAKDYAAAVDLFRRACNDGDAAGCNNLGLRYRDGEGIEKDEGQAFTLFRRACDGGDMWGCNNLGVAYAKGTGVAKDDAKAVDLYRRACDGGNETACNNLGARYQEGRGVAKDDAKAREYYKRACKGGDETGCKNLEALDRPAPPRKR
jgi:TPR repeat protein